ncbi:MAG TPA: sigma-70 family RNA polymerase sigma factor [Phycisphaerae bacterium]|nr:sigma-70 family RNA polymerase sigma factor [Phycisphaerae bacterium]
MFAGNADPGSGKLTRRAEKRLITQARSGCEEAARALVETHQDRLFAFVWRILRDHHEAEEICQEAFLRAFGALETFSAEFRFSTWLFTIAYRLCLNQIRRRKSLTGDLDFSGVSSGEPEVADRVAESEEARLLKDEIWKAVDQLSMPQRAAVVLFYREGMSCEAIAKTLGIPMATAKSHLHRARGRLRESLVSMVQDTSQIRALREAAS